MRNNEDLKKVVIIDNVYQKYYDELKSDPSLGGFVTIIDKETGETIINKARFTKLPNVKGKSNKILYSGREVAAQRMFNIDRVQGSGEKDLFIHWIGIGSGGADSANCSNPIEPTSSDTGLVTPITLDASNPNYADVGKKKAFDSVEFLPDRENDNRFLLVKITVTIDFTDANNHPINEAVLYLSDDTNPITANKFVPWARVTFSTISKHSRRAYQLIWYVFF